MSGSFVVIGLVDVIFRIFDFFERDGELLECWVRGDVMRFKLV